MAHSPLTAFGSSEAGGLRRSMGGLFARRVSDFGGFRDSTYGNFGGFQGLFGFDFVI